MAERPFAYVCSPLRGDTSANMAQAREYSRQVFEAGYCPITPHIFFPQFLKDDIPAEREAGMKMGESLLPLCRVLVVCGDTISEGMKQEIAAAQNLGIETCTLLNIPPIPTLNSFRDDLSNLDKIDIAIFLIEGMTGCRFVTGLGGTFISPDRDAYLAINMRNKWDFNTKLCHITFDANIHTMGQPMSADSVLKLQQEINRTHTLLSLLESREFILTPDEMQELHRSIQQRNSAKVAPLKDVEKPAEKESAVEKLRQGKQAANQNKTNTKKHDKGGREL